MAKPNPAPPRQNFLQTTLLMIAIFLAFQFFFNPSKNTNQGTPFQGRVLHTQEDFRQALVEADAKGLDQTGQTLLREYDRLVDQDVDAKKITRDEADRRKLQGAILVADAALKDGIARNETWRIRNAYQALVPYQRQFLNKPGWDQPVSVPVSSRFGWNAWSGQSLYEKVVATLGERNRNELIWGFIPGGYAFIDFLVHVTGAHPDWSYAFAAFLLALAVRAAIFPLAQKQYMFSRQMSQLGPLVKEIREKYADDKMAMNQKVMELYKEYGINPTAGCFPAFIQMPLFFTVYQCMLLYQFEFTRGTFLWVNPHTSAMMPEYIAANLGSRDAFLIVIYGITMTLSTLLQPVNDPAQVKQQRLMGVGMSLFMTFTMFTGLIPVPAAFVLYWIFLNILATVQAIRAYRLPLPPLVKVNAAGGGVYPAGMGGKWGRRIQEIMEQAQAQQNARGDQSPNGSVPRLDVPEIRTGAPAKHKPKKRK